MKWECSKSLFLRIKRGFTLIELLVVVLIIAILAAVAVPQYNKAVKKARATEAISNLYKIRQAQQIYYLQHGKYTDDISELDLEFNPGFYRYYCIHETLDCYAQTVDGSRPVFEMAGKTLYCRGSAQQCAPFSTQGQNGYYVMPE